MVAGTTFWKNPVRKDRQGRRFARKMRGARKSFNWFVDRWEAHNDQSHLLMICLRSQLIIQKLLS